MPKMRDQVCFLGKHMRHRHIWPDAELIESLQESYAQAARVPGMARLRSTIPHLATWDDHDYGKNDAGAEFAGRARRLRRLFLQFWNVPPTDPAPPARGNLPQSRTLAQRASERR